MDALGKMLFLPDRCVRAPRQLWHLWTLSATRCVRARHNLMARSRQPLRTRDPTIVGRSRQGGLGVKSAQLIPAGELDTNTVTGREADSSLSRDRDPVTLVLGGWGDSRIHNARPFGRPLRRRRAANSQQVATARE